MAGNCHSMKPSTRRPRNFLLAIFGALFVVSTVLAIVEACSAPDCLVTVTEGPTTIDDDGVPHFETIITAQRIQ